jgi:hypothetical protein
MPLHPPRSPFHRSLITRSASTEIFRSTHILFHHRAPADSAAYLPRNSASNLFHLSRHRQTPLQEVCGTMRIEAFIVIQSYPPPAKANLLSQFFILNP